MPSLKLSLKAITPQHIPTTRDYWQAIEKATYKTAALVHRDLLSTTRTWEHKPDFDITVTRGSDFTITAGTDDRIYGWVDAGTKPHPITAKRSPYLVFQWNGFRPKTRVGIIGSQDGSSGTDWAKKKSVKHPGTKGRKFIVKIRSRRQVTFQQEVSDALADVAKTQK